jgi:predicted dehydrogenase
MAVVGAGRLGGFHAQKLAAMEEVELVAVVDPADNRCRQLASQCNTRPLHDHRQLPTQLDGVVIAAPTHLHRDIGIDLLERGVHVLMEKPLAATEAEADDLVRAARNHRTVLQVGHVERFNPAFLEAAGQVQEPKFIEAVRASGFTFRSTDIGVVLDLMIHDLDLVLSMVRGEVAAVDAVGLSVLGGHEDVANARIRFSCGAVASLSASRVSYQAVRKMSVWSAQGHASIDFGHRTTTLVRPSEALTDRRFHVHSLSAGEVEHYKTHLLEEHLPREEKQFEAVDALRMELEDFIGSIRGTRSPRVPGEQGRNAVALADLILSRIRSHQWDGRPTGRIGPTPKPRRTVVPAPHWLPVHTRPNSVPPAA